MSATATDLVRTLLAPNITTGKYSTVFVGNVAGCLNDAQPPPTLPPSSTRYARSKVRTGGWGTWNPTKESRAHDARAKGHLVHLVVLRRVSCQQRASRPRERDHDNHGRLFEVGKVSRWRGALLDRGR
jgi:hypothetical protein